VPGIRLEPARPGGGWDARQVEDKGSHSKEDRRH
jgi:hypothetical protein